MPKNAMMDLEQLVIAGVKASYKTEAGDRVNDQMARDIVDNMRNLEFLAALSLALEDLLDTRTRLGK